MCGLLGMQILGLLLLLFHYLLSFGFVGAWQTATRPAQRFEARTAPAMLYPNRPPPAAFCPYFTCGPVLPPVPDMLPEIVLCVIARICKKPRDRTRRMENHLCRLSVHPLPRVSLSPNKWLQVGLVFSCLLVLLPKRLYVHTPRDGIITAASPSPHHPTPPHPTHTHKTQQQERMEITNKHIDAP